MAEKNNADDPDQSLKPLAALVDLTASFSSGSYFPKELIWRREREMFGKTTFKNYTPGLAEYLTSRCFEGKVETVPITVPNTNRGTRTFIIYRAKMENITRSELPEATA